MARKHHWLKHPGMRSGVRVLAWSVLLGPLILFAIVAGAAGFHWPTQAIWKEYLITQIHFVFYGALAFAVIGYSRSRPGLPLWVRAVGLFVMALLASSGALLVAEWLRLKPATGVLPNLGRSLAIGFGVSAVVLLVEWLYHRLEVERRDAERRNLERERALRLAAEARWNSLESRLRPHFLFNALSSLRELMHQDLARADKMLQSFAELLRFSLNSAQSSLIPLREELEMVRNYLSIEQIRLGARLRWSVTAPPDSGEAAVPAMSLLSLVENAVKHGISPQRRGGRVDVTVERGENALRVCVRDDGPGIAVAEWPAGHGLAMLHERLHALYGAESDLRVLPSATGAMVEMRIPATQQVRKGAESEPSALLRRG